MRCRKKSYSPYTSQKICKSLIVPCLAFRIAKNLLYNKTSETVSNKYDVASSKFWFC